MCEIDGNNSLKRTGAFVRHVTEQPDSRRPRMDYWLSRDEVDHFKDEVPSRPGSCNVNFDFYLLINFNSLLQSKQKGRATETIDDDTDPVDDWEDVDENDPLHICINRWCNAGPEQRKRMFKMFDESGLFLCACRHGLILLMCDMIRSGEL
jgi:hypothetical protein